MDLSPLFPTKAYCLAAALMVNIWVAPKLQCSAKNVVLSLCNCPAIKQFACRRVLLSAHTQTIIWTYVRKIICTSFLLAYVCPHLNFKINKTFQHLHIILIFLIGLHFSLLIQNGAIWNRHTHTLSLNTKIILRLKSQISL